ncbi:ATP-dependent DNA helicase RRM3-like protein [Tanacetum coccineum]
MNEIPTGKKDSKGDTIAQGKSNNIQTIEKDEELQRKQGFTSISKEYIDIGDLTFPCESCGALLWHAKTLRKATDVMNELYSICYGRGKIKLGTELKQPPKLLKDLITNIRNKSTSIIENIRHYNSMFAFTSMGCQVDDTVNLGRGPNRVTDTIDGEEVEEIKDFYDCRYLSACEAAWRIYGFDIYNRTPFVEWLPFHLQDEQSVIFDATESIDYTLEKALVNETKFVKGPKECLEQKTYDNIVYETYRDACYACGLLQVDKEYIDGLLEANRMSRPEVVWEKTWHVMAADVENVERIKQNKPRLELNDIQRKNICLAYIKHMLLFNNKSLKNILNMPYPNSDYTMEGYNRLIYDEKPYKPEELKIQHEKLYGSLTTEQKEIYLTVMDDVEKNTGGMFFVYGYGGTGKTYLYKTLSVTLRSEGEIVLNVASRCIAALLLEGGRRAHSRFAILINIVKDSMCHILADRELANLIRESN